MNSTAQSQSVAAMVTRSLLVIAIGLALSSGTPYALRALGAGAWAKPTLGAHGFYELFIAVGFAGVVISVMAMWRSGLWRAVQELALSDIAPAGCAVCLAAIAAALGVLLYAGARYQEPDPGEMLLFGIIGPFVEEVLFRGFLFRQLRRWAGVPFVYAALVSSLLFGADHFDQADSLTESLTNSGITFAGGMMFCWLVERWGSIWPGFVVHAGLNVAWTLYTLGDNAVGGAMGNIARLATIVVAIAGTLLLTRRPQSALASG
jgi:membrane protease YdiL (CAAX protease family)